MKASFYFNNKCTCSECASVDDSNTRGKNCLAYAYDQSTLECALLDGTLDNMCSEPVVSFGKNT